MVNFYIFLTLFIATAGEFNILLLHTNDLHAHFAATDKYSGVCPDTTSTLCYGGFARLHSEVIARKQEAAERVRPTVFLHAGDSYQGTPYYTFFKWPIVAKFVNMLGIDVMCLGNHEFDGGVEGLAPYIRDVTAPVVCSNLDISLAPALNQPNLTPSKILTINGKRIGIIGYLTPDTMVISNVGAVRVLDEIPYIRAEAKKLLEQNVTILIALGHSGYLKDQQIAKEVEEIDVVVGGHSHSFLYTGTPPDREVPVGQYPTVITQSSGKQVPVVQAYFATKYLGYLELDFDDSGNLKSFRGSPILLSGNLPQDPEILEALKPYEQQIASKLHRIVGYTGILLDNTKCAVEECNIGNLITDAFVDYACQERIHYQGGLRAPMLGINQAGSIRASINPYNTGNPNGSITVEDVITVIPWAEKLLVLSMDGSVLVQALEHSVARYDLQTKVKTSEFLQVSGLQVVYDVTKPTGNRVVSVGVLCRGCDPPKYLPLKETGNYRVVMSDYLATGGDGFSMFKNLTNRVVLDEIDYIVISNYIEKKGRVSPFLQERIKFITSDSKISANDEIFT